jgi:pantoate--beta-alanine ligase
VKILRTKKEVREFVAAARRAGKSVGLVPTMGALHEGHLSLVRRSVSDNAVTVVSIFVNPTQFGPKEDLAKYPRMFDADVKLCEKEKADAIFVPEAGEMYPKDVTTFVEETKLSRGLCGVSRPTHFRGVTTVVAKLINIVTPDRAYFGQKDAQQAAVIKRMVRDLDMPVEIVVMPIVREKDGLAMSSRNKYLTGELRGEALVLSQALTEVERAVKGGERKAAPLVDAMRKVISRAPHARIDYAEIMDAETFEPVAEIARPALVALAVFVGETRLIDNTILAP